MLRQFSFRSVKHTFSMVKTYAFSSQNIRFYSLIPMLSFFETYAFIFCPVLLR